ncbi:hypothetical protein G3R49_12580 [Shewanella sp. WXL01]|uniref:hypothetical protein n=1 Tax=Shewanella sp. WXL01 TaxID=2709721 RepID=UPI001438479F|nr:hypothetical protein [Shewanella sp. WXL01]NKF51394.1 hypothetical protein [Shewanella sp. WXL01]
MIASNQQVLNQLETATRCAAVLDKRGVAIKAIDIKGRRPAIEVDNCNALRQFKPAVHAIENVNGQRNEVLTTEVYGAEVFWSKPVEL